MAIYLYLIRHGRTEWNEQGRLQGWGDSPLIESGIIGAKRTGEALSAIPFAACYSSLMKRAQDTADYIIGERAIPHFHHRGLNEIFFGRWEGKLSQDLIVHPEYQQLRTDPKSYLALDSQGETIEQLYQRTISGLQQIIARHQEGENILIVSHGMTLTLLTAVIKGLAWQDFRDENRHQFIKNTAINIVKVEQGKMELITMNQADHL